MSEFLRFSVISSLLVLTPALVAEVTSVEPVADTCLSEYTENYNFGSQTDLPSGGLGGMAGTLRLTRALFKFDIAAALPADATIVSARMRLHVTRIPTNGRASEFSLNRVLVPWQEGDKSGEQPGGAEATSGESTWNHRFSVDTPWTVPGGEFGADFSTTSSATLPGVDGAGEYIFDFNPTGIDDIQSALDQPLSNHGWVLWSLSEGDRLTARRWASREATEDLVPKLEITWTQPPAAKILSIVKAPDSEAFEVRFMALAGFTYQMETSDFLDQWLAGDSLTPESDGEEVFTLPIEESTGFLRIRSLASP